MDRVKVVTSVQRKWRWTAEQNRARVQEAEQSKMSIYAVTRKHEIHPPVGIFHGSSRKILANCIPASNNMLPLPSLRLRK